MLAQISTACLAILGYICSHLSLSLSAVSLQCLGCTNLQSIETLMALNDTAAEFNITSSSCSIVMT